MQNLRMRLSALIAVVATTMVAGCASLWGGNDNDKPSDPPESQQAIDKMLVLPECASTAPLTVECRNAVASYLIAVADREFYADARALFEESGVGANLKEGSTIAGLLDVALEGAVFWEISKVFRGAGADEKDAVARDEANARAESKRAQSSTNQRRYSAWGLLVDGVSRILRFGRDKDTPADLVAKMELNRRAVLDKIMATRSAPIEDYPMTALLADIQRYLYYGDVDVAKGL